MRPLHINSVTPDVYMTDQYVVLDFEVDTSHGDYGNPVHADNALLLACYKSPGDQTARAAWGDEYSQAALVQHIMDADLLVCHNAKYELGWLLRCGLDLRNVLVFDTKIAEYVLLGNLAAGDKVMPGRSTSLNDCAIRRGLGQKDPVVDTMIGDGINPVRLPRPWLEARCRKDVEDTEQVFLSQRESLRRTNRLGVLLTRCLLTPVLADIERNGMTLDAERVHAEYVAHTERLSVLNVALESLTGGINWRSSKQVAELLYNPVNPRPVTDEAGNPEIDKEGNPVLTTPGLGFAEVRKYNGEPLRTKGGKKGTSQKILAMLVPKTKRQKEFLDLRQEIGKVNAALVKNLEFFEGVCQHHKGTFKGTFNQTVTATHRLSSSGIPLTFSLFGGEPKARSVQFQNLPRAFKPLFMAPGLDWLMGELDGAQLEFRVAAALARDEQAKIDILSGHDVHKFTASILFNVPYDDVTKEQRQAAKPHTFKPLYGGQSGTEAEQRYYAAFRLRYPEIAAMQSLWVAEVLESKRLVTSWGMRYYWPYARRSSSGYVNVTSAVYNYPVQALATAEIIPIAVRAFWEQVQDNDLTEVIHLVNTVHDSVVCELRHDASDWFKALGIESFTTSVYNYLTNVYNMEFDWVPLGVGMSYGTHWGGKGNEEIELNVFPDGTRKFKSK